MAAAGRPEPRPGLLRRLDALARACFPATATALLMVLAGALAGLPSAIPAIALACVFFWSLFRPGVMPPPAVFALGLLQDLLTFAPLGGGVLLLLLVHGFAVRWRRTLARQSFLLVWLAFCGFAACGALLGFALQMVLGWHLPPSAPAGHLLLLTIGLYPALAWVMIRVHRAMREAEALA